MLLQQLGRLVDLVDHAASRPFAKQHGRRSLEHFDAVLVEGVALDQRRVAQPVHIDVAGLPERKAAQSHIFLAGFTGLEGHACGGLEHFAEVVEVAVAHQALGHHGHGLRDVAQRLSAFADFRLAHP